MNKCIWWFRAVAMVLIGGITNSVLADISSWLDPDGGFVVLDSQVSEASLYVGYPRLGDNNCGVRVVIHSDYNTVRARSILAENVEVVDGDRRSMSLVATGRFGNVYEFGDMTYQAYASTVRLQSKTGSFQDIFTKIKGDWLRNIPMAAIATAVSCDHIAEAKANMIK